MALEGSHIRFALDLKDVIGVTNLDKYVSGTIYPDSRYVSKIDRVLTHDIENLEKAFRAGDDFKKGWFIHLLLDKIQSKYFREFLQMGKSQWGDEGWIKRTALKVLQDLSDVKKFPIKNYIKHLEYLENPNGEEELVMKHYNDLMINFYAKDELVIDDFYDMWIAFGIGEELSARIKNQVIELQKDEKLLEQVEAFYDKFLEEAKLFLETNHNL